MKSFFRTFLITGVPFGIWMGIFFGVTRGGIGEGVYSGLFSGLFFGLVIAWIVRIHEKRASDSPPVLTEEQLLREGAASHSKGRQGQAGRLYLTDSRILFEGFPTNKPVYRVSVPIHEIVELQRHRSYGVFPVLLDVIRKDGERERFVTDDVNQWIDEISSVRQGYLDTMRSDEKRLFP